MGLEISNLRHRYMGAKSDTLGAVSFALESGEIGCLLGPSGCGKTTVLRCIAGFEKVAAGSIKIGDQEVSAASMHLPPEKRRIGIVFQDYALFPHMTVYQNVAFGLTKASKAEIAARVDDVLARVELTAFKNRYPSELSGGQQQRVALARSLAPQPRLLLLDEPFSNLDNDLRERMKIEVKQLLKSFRVTALLVTHNQDEAFDIGDKIGVLDQGEILQWGSSYDLYHEPACRRVAEFLGNSTFIPARADTNKNVFTTEIGHVPMTDVVSEDRKDDLFLLCRPDDIIHDDECPPTAEVVGKNFRGMYLIYHLRLPSGQTVQCFTSSHHDHEIGQKVGIRLDMKHAIVFDKASGKRL